MTRVLQFAMFCCIISFSASIQGCKNPARDETTRYYTKLTGIISPYFAYKPRGEISEKEAQNMSHYQAIHDHKDRLTELRFFKKGLKSNDSYFRTHQVKYEYRGNTLARSYFDAQGTKSHMWRHYYMGGEIHQEIFTLDQNGNKQKLALFDSLGARTETALKTYSYKWKPSEDGGFIQEQFKRDKSPNYLTPYFPFYISKITSDRNGHLYSISNVDSMGNEVMSNELGYAKVIFDFDQFGNERGWAFYDIDGNLANRQPYEETDYGYAKWDYSIEWQNQKLGTIKALRENYFDKHLNPVTNNFSVHEVRYQADELGNFTSIAFYDLNGQRLMHPERGFFRLEMEYDEKGERVATTRYDTENNQLH